MKESIQLCLKNEKTVLDEQIVSNRAFPVTIFSGDSKYFYAVFTFMGDEILFDRYITELAKFIINRYEKKLVARSISRRYNEIPYFKIRDILDLIKKIDDDEKLGRKVRVNAVKRELVRYFKENDNGNVEGLLLFRMPEYIALSERLADRIVELYFTEKEYDEFIGLLKYFVSVQGDRPPFIHLLVNSRAEYTILDENEDDITAECIGEFASADEVVYENYDDLLISILITLAPEKIIVHNGSNILNKELFNTILKVFEKVEYCMGCEKCKKCAEITQKNGL